MQKHGCEGPITKWLVFSEEQVTRGFQPPRPYTQRYAGAVRDVWPDLYDDIYQTMCERADQISIDRRKQPGCTCGKT